MVIQIYRKVGVDPNCPLYIFEKVIFEQVHKDFLEKYNDQFGRYIEKPKCDKVFSVDDLDSIYLELYKTNKDALCRCKSFHVPYSPDNIGDFSEYPIEDFDMKNELKWYS